MFSTASKDLVLIACAAFFGFYPHSAAALGSAAQEPGLTTKREVIQAGAAHEECFRLESGDQVDYQFESSKALSFNIHYHEGDKVLEPVKLANALYGRNTYKAAVAQAYCLMWANPGKAEAKLQYGFRIQGRSIDAIR